MIVFLFSSKLHKYYEDKQHEYYWVLQNWHFSPEKSVV